MPKFDRISYRTLSIYSNRFADQASISITAATSGILPVYKQDTQAAREALKATVKFIETHLASRSPHEQFAINAVNEFQQILIRSLEEPLARQKQWSQLTRIFVALSVLLILVGAVSAIFWNIQVGTLSSISSILTGTISSLLFIQMQRSQNILEKNKASIKSELNKSIDRLYRITSTQTKSLSENSSLR